MFSKYLEKHREEFLSHVRPEYQARKLSATPITLEEYKEMRMNSFEDKFLQPLLSDEAFIWKIQTSLMNCLERKKGEYETSLVYGEWVLSDGVYQLLERFQKLLNK